VNKANNRGCQGLDKDLSRGTKRGKKREKAKKLSKDELFTKRTIHSPGNSRVIQTLGTMNYPRKEPFNLLNVQEGRIPAQRKADQRIGQSAAKTES